MTKTHFQQPVFCKQAIHALLICNDQIPLEAYCTRRPYSFKFFKGCLPQNLLSPLFNALSQVCKIKYIKFLQFANIKQRKKLPHKFQRILNRSPYKKNFLILKLCVTQQNFKQSLKICLEISRFLIKLLTKLMLKLKK